MRNVFWMVAMLFLVGCGQEDEPKSTESCQGLDAEACEAVETCAFTTECVVAPTEAECLAMDEDQCLLSEICRPKYGAALQEDKFCAIPTFFSCERYEQCNNLTPVFRRDDGLCAKFNNDCMPSVGDWTQGPNGGFDIAPGDCGIPAFLDSGAFNTCLDWEGTEGKPTSPEFHTEPSLDFGEVEIAGTATQDLQFANAGTPVTITAIELESDQFSFVPIELPLVLDQGEVHTLEVTASPTTSGVLTGGIKFISDSELLQEVPLSVTTP